jgi:predicted nuclease of predicted toxin-antitoxin system
MPGDMPTIRILLDNNVPIHLARLLPDETLHATALGWHTLSNGDLIREAQAHGFTIMITADQNIRYQQTVSGGPLAFIVLTTTHWRTIRESVALIQDAIGAAKAGEFVVVSLQTPPRLR